MSVDETKRQHAGDARLVVGVGASAGGVEALSQLFASMPADLGASFVVVTHLGPHRETLLGEILARHTSMPVLNAADGLALEPDHIYVLPSDSVLTLSGNCLQLRTSSAEPHERNPIDVFFASLSREKAEAAVGIILSGGGSDGTLGIRCIKQQGGLTIAQGHDHSGPRHESMPASAIASGLIDLVLPVDEIGRKLQEYAQTYGNGGDAPPNDAERRQQERIGEAIKDIFAILRKRIGHDFERYKEKTFLRRVQRRMHVLQIDDVSDYVERLRHEGDEAGLLFRDLLIGVTSFFRDPEAFETVAEKVIPKLFENVGANDLVRVWVPGCATGEEAYTFAILLREHMDQLSVVPKIQVFATDIDETALAVARAGRYPSQLLEHVSPQRLKRFFRAEPGSYVLSKDVRDLCIFSAHNVIRDPPFSRIDLVSCRNLLIYFNSELQDNVLPVFHYALKPGGYLFLGPSESLSRSGDLFGVIDKKHRIFQRRSTISPNARMPLWIAKGRDMSYVETGVSPKYLKEQRFRQQVEARVLDSFAPAHIVVDGEGEIVFFSSRTGKYLEPQMGSPTRQILSMARKGLRLELRAALMEAAEKRHAIVRERIEVALEDRIQFIRLTVEPLIENDHEPLYMVVFTDLGPPLTPQEAIQHRPVAISSDLASLEQELRETRDRLQATIEEHETALEELKSGNEELQSTNEELQTVNQELASKVDELHRSNADLRNLFESTQIATVFLDRHMLIRNYTPAVTAIFNLIPSDRGRPITDIAHQLQNVDLVSDVRQVLDQRKGLERPVQLRDGRIFHLMRVLPYRTAEGNIDGALITFVDVTAVVAAEEQQRLLVAELNHRVRNMLQVVIGLAHQTLHRCGGLEEFEQSFMGRMQALARAYELLSRDGWRNVPLSDLINTQLNAFATAGRRYSSNGDPVVLQSAAALSLGLIFYELATNATKYGALSAPDGKVDVSWKVAGQGNGEDEFQLVWQESGGPPVRTPGRAGFGTELVQRQLHHELKGKASMDFEPSGLRVTLAVPARYILVDTASSSA